LVLAAEEVPAETEPKFNPFTGAGRRLDGKPLSYQPPPALSSSVSKDKQPAVADGSRQPSLGSSSQNTARKSQGKLVFGSNTGRTPKETQREVLFLPFIILNLTVNHTEPV
jgi:ubiquitin fusion degradation protein 1